MEQLYNTAVQILSDVFIAAIPIAIFYALCDLAVRTFLRAAFGGKLWLRD